MVSDPRNHANSLVLSSCLVVDVPDIGEELIHCVAGLVLCLRGLRVGLLLDVLLRTTLLRLAPVMHVLVVLLPLLVAGQVSDGAADGALGPVTNAACVVVELAPCLLLLSLEILLAALLLKVLCPKL